MVAPSVGRMALSDTERRLLDLAGTYFKYPAVRDAKTLAELGLNGTRAAQIVNALLDRPDAEAAMPMEIRRLRRLRDARRGMRRAG